MQNLDGENFLVVPPQALLLELFIICMFPGSLPPQSCPFSRRLISGPLFLENLLNF